MTKDELAYEPIVGLGPIIYNLSFCSQFPDGWVGVTAQVFAHFHPESHNQVKNNGGA